MKSHDCIKCNTAIEPVTIMEGQLELPMNEQEQRLQEMQETADAVIHEHQVYIQNLEKNLETQRLRMNTLNTYYQAALMNVAKLLEACISSITIMTGKVD